MNSNAQSFLAPGVLDGTQTRLLFEDAKTRGYAIPAINVIDLHGIHAALEAASLEQAPIIIQFSYKGSLFLGGQGLTKTQKDDDVAALGAILGAKYVHQVAKFWNVPIVLHTDHAPKVRIDWLDKIVTWEENHFNELKRGLFSSHMIDFSLEPLEENLNVCTNFFRRLNRLNQLLEIEIGCTGGEEDGLEGSKNKNLKNLYSDPKDVTYAFETLQRIGQNFTIAASFGNVHGVYTPGSVKLDPSLLDRCQKTIEKKCGLKKPALFVFHGSSGSLLSELKTSITYGVVKVNIDTDTQWAQWQGLLNYFKMHKDRLMRQVGTTEDSSLPNKQFYDPRVWLRKSEEGMRDRIQTALVNLNTSKKIC